MPSFLRLRIRMCQQKQDIQIHFKLRSAQIRKIRNQDVTETSKEIVRISWSSSEDDETSPQVLKLASSGASSSDWFIGDSPVIGAEKPEACSPSLTENTNVNTSPVIGRSRLLRKIRYRRNYNEPLAKIAKRTLEIEESNSQTDSFGSELSLVIDASGEAPKHADLCISSVQSQQNVVEPQITPTVCGESPKESMDVEISLIETQKEPELEVTITEVASPECMEVLSTTSNSTTPKTSSTNVSVQLNQRKRRRKLKKDGLSFQLRKALLKQKTDLAIWQHEMYLNKEKRSPTDLTGIKLLVKRILNEYGRLIFYCDVVNGELPSNYAERCVVIASDELISYCSLATNSTFELFSPYSVKKFKYEGEWVNCYYNVSKLCKCN